jgi:phosphate transport system ATP-binding protein
MERATTDWKGKGQGSREVEAPVPETNGRKRDKRTVESSANGKRVEAKDVNLFYGDFHAVQNVSMAIEPNQVTALIGSSGCGKTTVLRSLNRMHELTVGARVEGEITLDGQNMYDPKVDPVEVRRLVGMVFQAPNPFPTMSVSENVAAGLTLNRRGMKKDERDQIVERSLRGAHLWDEVKDRLDEPGSGLSGGQQQRLCIARAIAVEPEVLLMDEPCSALDPVATLAIEDLIAELKSRYTIAIVTHNMQQAARASDVTAFFNLEASGKPGRLIEIGPTQEMFTRPQQKETEDYVSGRFG